MFLADITMDASRNLSYRGALTSNLIAINGFESAATAQSSARIDLLDNEYIISNTIRKCESQLMGNAVPGGMAVCTRRRCTRILCTTSCRTTARALRLIR